ncbi:hypothetical protein Nepgr_003284 [Nepenthes gracilis]|uniref:Uncharacterized protein n=1 Tax=Nepenthes gracilis TaxID=150966 RepID=A0AAD3RZ75_NEPGR|nr:hypothetical protein Nepgr_003284 [Nepenthes gracilis]
MATDRKIHVFEDVLKHNTCEDCWIIIYGKIQGVDRLTRPSNVLLAKTRGKVATVDQSSTSCTSCCLQAHPSVLPCTLPEQGRLKERLSDARLARRLLVMTFLETPFLTHPMLYIPAFLSRDVMPRLRLE